MFVGTKEECEQKQEEIEDDEEQRTYDARSRKWRMSKGEYEPQQ